MFLCLTHYLTQAKPPKKENVRPNNHIQHRWWLTEGVQANLQAAHCFNFSIYEICSPFSSSSVRSIHEAMSSLSSLAASRIHSSLQLPPKILTDVKRIQSCWDKAYKLNKNLRAHSHNITYRKIPKISTGAYIFQRPFLRGLFLEGLIFGGAYLRREICVSKSIGLILRY